MKEESVELLGSLVIILATFGILYAVSCCSMKEAVDSQKAANDAAIDAAIIP